MGYEVSTRVLSITKETLDKKTFSKFSGIKSPVFFCGPPAAVSQKTPLSVHTSYIPAELCPDLGRHDIATEQMCTILSQDYGLHRAKTIETLESVPATAHEADPQYCARPCPLLPWQDVIQNEQPPDF
ncbi:MAG: UTRA domain-containing protein [Intestinimonas sp.]